MSRAGEDTLPAGTMAGTPQVLLAHHLKQLKLPTVLREYDKVARECARDGVDHPRYLLRLIELALKAPTGSNAQNWEWIVVRDPAVKAKLDQFAPVLAEPLNLADVKAATSHLKGLKIGVMGCIVNGPGEMADADYGYVGAAVGKVSLYKGKECVERNVPQDVALTHLIDLIKANGDWTEPKQ